MPVDRSRSINSQGRQKSCSECAKSKRRCGLEQPGCARCVRRQLDCVYPPQPRVHVAVPHASTPANDTESEDPQVQADLLGLGSPRLDFDFDLPAMQITADILDFDFPADPPATLRNEACPEDEVSLQKPRMRLNFPSSAHLSPFAKARVGYFVEQVKLVPQTMVERIGAPWMHPKLYEDHMPRCLQDAHASCAMIVTKNETNIEYIVRYIGSRAEDLRSAATPDSPIEMLAYTHALMLYLIIFIFGGETRFCIYIEPMLFRLQEMGAALLPTAIEEDDPVGPLPLYPATVAQSAWQSFIFRESVRRTVPATLQINIMCDVLNNQMKECVRDYSLKCKITFSAHLWNAMNAIDFAIAWNTRNHFVVKGLDFTELLEKGQPNDLDVFANMVLISLYGIDDIRGWYHTRGGTLAVPQS